MSEYISKEKAIELLVDDYAYAAAKIIEKMKPEKDVVKIKHAHYEIVPNQTKKQAVPDVRCSNCQRVLKHKKENYCSHCGARLEG